MTRNYRSNIPITAGTQKWVRIYIQKIRCHIETYPKQYLFLKTNGKRFHSGEISKQLSALFQAVGLPSTNATIFRKSSTTDTYKSENYEAPTLLASLLDHDMGTGRREYDLFSKDSRVNIAEDFNEQLVFSKPLDDMI